MNVTVEYFGQLRQFAGAESESGQPGEGTTVQEHLRELAERHYAVHRGKDFYPPLVEYITSAPVVVMVVAGPSAIEVVRKMMGATDSRQADPGTIRGDWGLSKQANLVHGSDSPQTAATEIALFFRPDELLNYDRADQKWVWPS